jgi:hypothetical protein
LDYRTLHGGRPVCEQGRGRRRHGIWGGRAVLDRRLASQRAHLQGAKADATTMWPTTSIPKRPARSSWTSPTINSRMGQPELAAPTSTSEPHRRRVPGGTPRQGPTRERPCPRAVSRLSAAIPYAASRRSTAPCPASSLSRAVAVPSKAVEGCVTWCGWHGMQGVRGSNPLSSTTGQRPHPASTGSESPASGSRSAAICAACPIQSSSVALLKSCDLGLPS